MSWILSKSQSLSSAGQSDHPAADLSIRPSVRDAFMTVTSERALAVIVIPALSTPTSNLMELSEEAEVWSSAIFQIISLHNRDVIVSRCRASETDLQPLDTIIISEKHEAQSAEKDLKTRRNKSQQQENQQWRNEQINKYSFKSAETSDVIKALWKCVKIFKAFRWIRRGNYVKMSKWAALQAAGPRNNSLTLEWISSLFQDLQKNHHREL